MINLKKDDAVADAIREILQQEALKGDQHEIDANKNNKIDPHDFKLLRAKKEVKKEEAEQVDEAKKESKEDFDARQKRLVAAGNETAKDPERLKKLSKIPGYNAAMNLAKKSTNEEVKDEYARKVDKYLKKKHAPDAPVKEEVEAIDEVKMADLPSTKVQGRSYGASKPEPHVIDTIRHPKDKELKSIEAEKKKPVNEEDAYDKNVKPSDKPHDKDAAKERAQTSAVAARKVMSMSTYSASKKGK